MSQKCPPTRSLQTRASEPYSKVGRVVKEGRQQSAVAEQMGLHHSVPASASQHHPHPLWDNLTNAEPSLDHKMFRKYHIPYILRCSFLFYISTFKMVMNLKIIKILMP